MSAPAPNTWQSIEAEVLRRIHSREWQPGELIPNETDLAVEFGCARATVNRALGALASAGLLDRRRRAGTRVALNPVRRATLEIAITRREVEELGARYAYRLLSCRRGTIPAAVAAALGLPAEAEMLHVRALHLADDAPYLLEDRWVNLAAVPEILAADLSRISANEWLVHNAPYTKGDFVFTAVEAAPEDAGVLAARPGAALFVLERTTWNGSQPVTWVRLSYAPGHRMRATA